MHTSRQGALHEKWPMEKRRRNGIEAVKELLA